MQTNVITYKSQEGKQYNFLSREEDIVIYGGAAGGGKTYALLLGFMRFVHISTFNAVIVRNTYTQITQAGGIWDTALELFSFCKCKFNATTHRITFPSGATLRFTYLAREDQLAGWQGAQIQLLCFDELTHFTKRQFFYLFTRVRTATKGLPLWIRATCNPDPDSWVREFVDFYLDEDGYAEESKCGATRYFVYKNDNIEWVDKKTQDSKSFTFINSNIFDNKMLIDANPDYLANLKNAGRVERERFLRGNWNVRYAPGDYFKKSDFVVVDEVPALIKLCRAWDFASSVGEEADYTVGVKVGIDNNSNFYVLDLVRDRVNPEGVEKLLMNTASQDGFDCEIIMPIDPGSSGKGMAEHYMRLLRSYITYSEKISGSKETRAKYASAKVGAGFVKVVRAKWNTVFFNELESFPEGPYDDIVDAFADAMKHVGTKLGGEVIAKPVEFM